MFIPHYKIIFPLNCTLPLCIVTTILGYFANNSIVISNDYKKEEFNMTIKKSLTLFAFTTAITFLPSQIFSYSDYKNQEDCESYWREILEDLRADNDPAGNFQPMQIAYYYLNEGCKRLPHKI